METMVRNTAFRSSGSVIGLDLRATAPQWTVKYP